LTARLPGNPIIRGFLPMLRIVLYVLAIVACGGAGALVGWAISGAIGLTGTPMALVASFLGMIAATGLWILGTVIHLRGR
jgi:hypothetical protein